LVVDADTGDKEGPSGSCIASTPTLSGLSGVVLLLLKMLTTGVPDNVAEQSFLLIRPRWISPPSSSALSSFPGRTSMTSSDGAPSCLLAFKNWEGSNWKRRRSWKDLLCARSRKDPLGASPSVTWKTWTAPTGTPVASLPPKRRSWQEWQRDRLLQPGSRLVPQDVLE
jgi:hypothetical protein